MWHPLKGSDQPHMIWYVLALNRPKRINALAVLRGGIDEAVSALRRTLDTWRSLVDPGGTFTVTAVTEPVRAHSFHRPTDGGEAFNLDLRKERQTEWDRLLTDLSSLQGLRVQSEVAFGPGGPDADYQKRYAARVHLHYLAPALHPHMPEYAARLGHVALSLPASEATKSAVIGLMQALASAGLIGQAYVAAWDHDDDPSSTLYECAANIFVHQRAAQGWGTRYLRAVADHLWLGPGFAAMLPDRAALERVGVISAIGDTLAIERRPEATLRDLELCLEPMLASQADSQAFWDRFRPPAKP
jgi:hypothetical protein